MSRVRTLASSTPIGDVLPGVEGRRMQGVGAAEQFRRVFAPSRQKPVRRKNCG
jgi:hypothetical protein